MTKLGEKGSDHWAIHAQLTGFSDKTESNVYDAKNMTRLEKTLAERSAGVMMMKRKSTVSGPGKTS